MQIVTIILYPIFSAFLLYFATPGIDLWFLAFVSLLPLLLSLDGDKKDYLKFFIFAVTFYILGLKWVIITVVDFGNAPYLFGIFLLFLFSIYLSIYWLIFVFFIKRFHSILLLSAFFVSLELVKGYLFTGFPWLNIGITQYNNSLFASVYSVIGESGFSFIIIFINFALYRFLKKRKVVYVIYGIIFIALVNVIGNLYNSKIVFTKKIDVSIIQPSYKQKEKWLQEKKGELISRVIDMLEVEAKSGSELIAMPESVFPTFCNREMDLLKLLKEISMKKSLIFGCLTSMENRFFNSVYFIRRGDVSIYNKIHLVPFGEYFPLKKILKPFEEYFFGDAQDFSSGEKVMNFRGEGFVAATPLCYESAYTFLTKRFLEEGANIFVFLSNDSWFGRSIGRWQHLAIDEIRALEYNRSLLRVTQSGISECFVPDKGRLKILKIGEKGSIKCSVPLFRGFTIFSRLGYWWLLIAFAIGLYEEKIFRKEKHLDKKE